MFSSSLSTILSLNGEGVQLLEQKHYSKATTAFASAIAEFRKVITQKGDKDMSGEEELVFSYDLSLSPQAEEAAENELPFVFENPIQVACRKRPHRNGVDAIQLNLNQAEMLKTLSFALVFNLALGFHQSALHHKTSTTSMLKIQKRFLKALAFYKLALGMYENGEVSLGIMEAIAIANNQAHIYTTVNEVELADACYHQVLSHIMLAADKGHRETILHFERFFSNVVVKPSSTARAA